MTEFKTPRAEIEWSRRAIINVVGDVPSIEGLLAEAGYERRTTARPGL